MNILVANNDNFMKTAKTRDIYSADLIYQPMRSGNIKIIKSRYSECGEITPTEFVKILTDSLKH